MPCWSCQHGADSRCDTITPRCLSRLGVEERFFLFFCAWEGGAEKEQPTGNKKEQAAASASQRRMHPAAFRFAGNSFLTVVAFTPSGFFYGDGLLGRVVYSILAEEALLQLSDRASFRLSPTPRARTRSAFQEALLRESLTSLDWQNLHTCCPATIFCRFIDQLALNRRLTNTSFDLTMPYLEEWMLKVLHHPPYIPTPSPSPSPPGTPKDRFTAYRSDRTEGGENHIRHTLPPLPLPSYGTNTRGRSKPPNSRGFLRKFLPSGPPFPSPFSSAPAR